MTAAVLFPWLAIGSLFVARSSVRPAGVQNFVWPCLSAGRIEQASDKLRAIAHGRRP
jgi:hypothetical protein